jgi:ankyrin repeat protein
MKSIEPNVANGGVNKPPPYPVERSTMISEPPAPDPHTADLVSAVQYGYYDRVVELVQPEPSLATTPIDGNITLLHWAAINNRIEIAEYLINKRAQIDAFGGELNSTPLHWAIRDGKLQMVAFLLSHQAQPSLFDGEGFSSIHLASMFGHTDIVAYLVAKGQDVDLLDKQGMTPLMHAALRVKNRDPTQLLIQLGAQVNLQNPTNKFTSLHYAIAGSNREAIQILLDAGAKTDIRNLDNETPYDLVAKWPKNRHLFHLLSLHRFSNDNLPKWLRFNSSNRRLGTKFLPYFIIIIVACIFQIHFSLIYKGVLIIALFFLTKGYTMIFFDDNVDRYLPIAIAQGSIFWLYACYLYYFLQYIHIISFSFLGLVICTYFSWSNYYLAQKCDPCVIVNNRDQQYRNIIKLV